MIEPILKVYEILSKLVQTESNLLNNLNTSLSNINNTIDNKLTLDISKVYPVGSIYINASVSTNPSTLLGFGTWTAFGSGRVLVGVDTSQTEFDTLGETGGAKTHTLTINEMPSHFHGTTFTQTTGGIAIGSSVGKNKNDSGVGDNTTSTGSGQAHNNLQPYITVYMWRRTA